MRSNSLITAAMFVLPLAAPFSTLAFGEIGTLPLQWELQDIKDNLGDIKNELRSIDSSIVQDRLNRMDREMNSAAIGAAVRQAQYDHELLDLFEESARSCPLHSTAYSVNDVIGDIAAHEQEQRDFSSYMRIPSAEVRQRLSPEIVAEIERMTYTDKAMFQQLIFEKLQELRDARNERLIKYMGWCRCDTGWTSDATKGMCVREGLSGKQMQTAPARATTDVQEARVDQQGPVPPDVPPDAWYGGALSQLIAESDINVSDAFRPSDLATRGEFVQLLVNSMDIPLSIIANAGLKQASFDDVSGRYQNAFEKAAIKGWVKGDGDCYRRHPCYAGPDRNINRAEAAALLMRAHDMQSTGDAPEFADVASEDWFADTIRKAASHCVLQGDAGTGRVRPADTLNRAEMVVMIARASKGITYPNCQE